MRNWFKENMIEKKIWRLPVMILIWNETVYYLGRLLSKHKLHFDFSVSIDHKIPLMPWTVSIYFICFAFWAVIYLYMAGRKKQDAYRFFLADVMGKVICLFFFVFLPTTLVRPEITGGGLWNGLMRFLYQIDAADNLFPSIHCMVSWYCFIGIRKQHDCSRWWKWGTFLFAAAICISTLTTKQHVLADVAGGIGFAELTYILADRILAKRGK